MKGTLWLVVMMWAIRAQAQVPAELVQHAVDLSLAQAKTHHPMRFELHKVDAKQDTTKAIIETKDGDVAMLIAVNGKPLTPEVAAAERTRLDDLLAHPEKQARRHHDEVRDAERVQRTLKQLPEAFAYTLMGTVACANGGAAGTCWRLSFQPKPGWEAPDLESSLLKSLAGQMWIDRAQGWMARLDAHFLESADIGGGLVARINKGGRAYFEQSDTGVDHQWAITAVKLEMTGKVVLFKVLAINTRQEISHFQAVPEMDYRAAVKMLEAQ